MFIADQRDKLLEQNNVLIKNISCLYTTAKLELERKDGEIKRLQEEYGAVGEFHASSLFLQAKPTQAAAQGHGWPGARS